MNLRKLLLLLIIAFAVSFSASAQKAAIKTQLLADVTLKVDTGVKVSFAPRWSLDIPGQFKGGTINEHIII